MKNSATRRLPAFGLMLTLAMGGLSACRGDEGGNSAGAEAQDPSAGLASTGEPADDQQVQLAITGMT